MLKRLSDRPVPDRQAIANSAMSTILADGIVEPKEVKFLENLFKALQLPQETLYSELHRRSVKDDPIEAKRGAQASTNGATPGAIDIDATRLAKLREETSAVSQMLSEIFVEDHPLPASSNRSPDDADTNTLFSGLDPRHARLLADLVDARAMSRLVFEDRARSLRLLPDGALETLIDWGFENFDETLIEEGDELTIAPHLYERLLDLRKSRKQ
jgi:hypothetical protein